MEFRASLCVGCASLRAESFDPSGPEYVVDALRCRACEAREQAAQSWRDDEQADSSGIYFTVTEAD